MAKRNLESCSDDIPTTSSHNTVFIDTTLGTHLAMIVSDTDTVSDLKKKIMSEHPRCFPSFGEIKVCSLKVKRKRYFYLLSDSMLVKSAYEGAKKSWFLSVDASSLQQCGDNQLSSNPDDSKQLALTCIRKTPSDDRKNHLPDSPLKRFSRLDASLLPQPGDIQYTNQNFFSTDRSGPGFSCKEVSKDLEMKVGHVDDSCKTAGKTFETEKYDMLIEGNKISQTNIERRDGNSEAGLDYFHGQTSAVESLRMGPASETKYRSKKKSGDAVSNIIVEDNNDSIDASGMHTSHLVIVHPELSSGIPGKEVLNEMGMVYMDVGKEPCNTPDTNIRSDSGGIHGTHVECKKDKSLNTSGDAHQNDSLIEASKSRPAEKKKRKRESKGPRNPSEEHTTLLSNFSEETPKANAKIPENSKENKLKPITATSDSLFIQPPEDVQLVASSTIGKKKRKMKNKLARDQVLADEPSSLHDDREESSKENGELVAKDSDKAFVAAIISEQNVQHATLSGTFEVSQKQKHPEPIQEVVERVKLPSSLPGIDASGPDTANEEVTSIAPEPGAGSGSKWRRKSKKHPSTNAKEFTLSALNELNNLKRDVTNSEHGNIIPDDQKAESSYPDKIAEQRELPQTHDYEAMSSNNCKPLIQGEADRHSKEAGVSANLLETNLVIESGKSAGRKRLKTRAKKSVATKPLMSSIEHADNSESGISSFVPHFNDHSSVVAKKEESIISQTKRTKISTPEAVDTTLNGANGETDAARTHESSHPDKIAEQRELPQTHDYEAMSFNNCKPLIQGEADRHSKEAGVSANLLETNLVIESGKSAGRKRLKTRAKKSVATKPLMSSIEHADNSESGISSFVPHFNDHSSVVAKKEESIIPQTRRTKISTPEAVDTTLNGANGKTDEMSGNDTESLHFNQVNRTQEKAENIDGNLGKKAKKNGTFDAKNFASFLVKEQANDIESSQLNQINMTPKNTENMDQKSRKKTKKNQNSAAESLQPINELEVGGEEASSNDGLRHADKPSKTKMKTKLIETSSKNQLTGRHPRHALIVNSTEVPSSDTPEGDYIGGPLQCDVDGCNIIDANYQADVSKGDDDRVNFKDYFGTGEHKREVAPIELVVDKVSEAKRSDGDVKSKKNAKKLVVPSSSPDLQNPLRSYVNQASERKSHGVKAADSQDAEQIQTIPQESKHTDVVNTSKAVHAYRKENGESLGPTNPGSESRDKNHQTKKETKLQSNLGPHHVTVSKVSNKKIGEVVNSSRQHEKSLLATPGAIFRDGSTESSEDESGDVNSDSSTKAPSDNSSSSGYAEVESKSSLELPSNGIYGAKEKDGEENIIKSRSSGPKNITMDMILRGSSRFKKAKLTATQSQLEDTESQPVDFVPDSQANL